MNVCMCVYMYVCVYSLDQDPYDLDNLGCVVCNESPNTYGDDGSILSQYYNRGINVPAKVIKQKRLRKDHTKVEELLLSPFLSHSFTLFLSFFLSFFLSLFRIYYACVCIGRACERRGHDSQADAYRDVRA